VSHAASRTEAAVRAYLASFAARDPDAIAALVTDDFENEHVAALGTGTVGRAGYRARLPTFLDDFPGLRYEIEEVLVDGDRAAAAYTLHAAPGSRVVQVRGVMRVLVRDGLIARRVDYWDALGYLHQLD
jgi:ketosteroid isomerase-like protein